MRFITPLLFGLLATPLLTLGQETEKKVVNSTSPAAREEYFVLKTAPDTRQGPYLRYAGENLKTLVVRGYYTNGQPDSTWAEFGLESKKPIAQGRYRAGRKVGVWSYATYAGKPAVQYDFGRGAMVQGQAEPFDDKVSFRPVAGGVPLDVAPRYASGPGGVMMFLGKYLRYPGPALRNNVQGEVRVAFVIYENGAATGHRVVKGLGSGCDEEALRVVQLLPPNWLPAQAGGQAVPAECELPVRFTIR